NSTRGFTGLVIDALLSTPLQPLPSRTGCGRLASMPGSAPETCGCPPTEAIPKTSGVHHLIITVNDLERSRRFYTALMPRLGYGGKWEAEGARAVGFFGDGGRFRVKQADPGYAGDRFSKDRVGLCGVA